MIEGLSRSSRRRSVLGTVAIAACLASIAVAATVAQADPPPALFAGGTNGIVFAHGAHGNPHGGRSAQLVYHFGSVMGSGAAVKSIFWGSSWGTYTGDKITGIDSFYAGVGSTAYAGTTTEYTDSSGHVSSAVTSGGHVEDTSSAPSAAPSTSQVLAVEPRALGTSAVPYGYY